MAMDGNRPQESHPVPPGGILAAVPHLDVALDNVGDDILQLKSLPPILPGSVGGCVGRLKGYTP